MYNLELPLIIKVQTPVDQKFVLTWEHMLGEKLCFEDPFHKVFVVHFNRDTNKPALHEGWSSISEFYGLVERHWCLLKLVAPCVFHMSIFDEEHKEIPYYFVGHQDFPPVPQPEPVVQVITSNPEVVYGEEVDVGMDQVVPFLASSPRTVLLPEEIEHQVVPEFVPSGSDEEELVYQRVLRTVLSPYMCYASQYVSSLPLCLYLLHYNLPLTFLFSIDQVSSEKGWSISSSAWSAAVDS